MRPVDSMPSAKPCPTYRPSWANTLDGEWIFKYFLNTLTTESASRLLDPFSFFVTEFMPLTNPAMASFPTAVSLAFRLFSSRVTELLNSFRMALSWLLQKAEDVFSAAPTYLV